MSLSLLTSEVDQLVPVVQAKASYERRQAENEEAGTFSHLHLFRLGWSERELGEDGIEAVLATLLEGIGKVRKGQPSDSLPMNVC